MLVYDTIPDLNSDWTGQRHNSVHHAVLKLEEIIFDISVCKDVKELFLHIELKTGDLVKYVKSYALNSYKVSSRSGNCVFTNLDLHEWLDNVKTINDDLNRFETDTPYGKYMERLVKSNHTILIPAANYKLLFDRSTSATVETIKTFLKEFPGIKTTFISYDKEFPSEILSKSDDEIYKFFLIREREHLKEDLYKDLNQLYKELKKVNEEIKTDESCKSLNVRLLTKAREVKDVKFKYPYLKSFGEYLKFVKNKKHTLKCEPEKIENYLKRYKRLLELKEDRGYALDYLVCKRVEMLYRGLPRGLLLDTKSRSLLRERSRIRNRIAEIKEMISAINVEIENMNSENN